MSGDPTPTSGRRRALLDGVAFGDHAGPVRLVGDPAPDLLPWVIAVAADVRLEAVGSACAARVRRRFPFGTARDGTSPSPLTVVSATGEGTIAVVERAFGATCRDGLVLLDLPMPLPPEERRLRRFFEASCVPGVEDGTESGRLTLLGRRGRGDPMDADAPDDPLPVSIVLFHDGSADPASAAGTLVDLLARPRFPVAELFIVDAAPKALRLPKDLFGLKPTSTRTALFPKSRTSREAAVDDALGGVSMPMVAVVDAGTRFVPNAHALLGLALEKSGREAVRGACVALDASRTSTVDACLFKTEAVRSEGAAGLDAVVARAGRPVLPGFPIVRPFPETRAIIGAR